MKFTLSTSGIFYPDKAKREKLEEIGFTFKPSNYKEFTITDIEPEIEINTIDELIQFTAKYGEIIVMGETIEIYDNYRE